MGSSNFRIHQLEQSTLQTDFPPSITMHKAIALLAIFMVVAALANGAPMPDHDRADNIDVDVDLDGKLGLRSDSAQDIAAAQAIENSFDWASWLAAGGNCPNCPV